MTPTPDVPAKPVASGTPTRRVLTEVHAERIRQDAKWGEQNHPTLWPAGATHERYRELADDWKKRNDDRVRVANAAGLPSDRNSAWDGVLLEEVFEALAESDPAKRRAELVQVVAVGVAMVEQIDREHACICSTDCPEDPAENPCPVCRLLDPYAPCPVVGFGGDESEVSR